MDVGQLADVFETHRKMSFDCYKLDACCYMSAPQLSWDAMLKQTFCKLTLQHDPEIFRMIDSGMRGGICHVATRYARANNKYMGALYRPSEPDSYICYWDATNLYGWALMQTLPTGELTWLTEHECSLDHIRDLLATPLFHSEQQYILEVDMECPIEMQDAWDEFPPAPEMMSINARMLSSKQVELYRDYYGEAGKPHSRKLICSFLPKRHYVVHSELLKYYIKIGMRLTHVHRGVKFNVSKIIGTYIEQNSERRAVAKAAGEKVREEFLKRMNVSIYGKTIENVKKRSDIRLLVDPLKARRLVEKPHCIGFREFDESTMGVEMRKVRALINKPFEV